LTPRAKHKISHEAVGHTPVNSKATTKICWTL